MKKIFAILITLIYFSSNASLAISKLYYLQNTTVEKVKPFVEANYDALKYKIAETNPYYGISEKNPNDYAIVILLQSGNRVYYFYKSNDGNKLNKKNLKSFKNINVDYLEESRINIVNIYDNIGERMLSTGPSVYEFQDNTPNTNFNSNVNNNSYNNTYTATNNYNRNINQQTTNTQNVNYSSNSTALRGYVAKIAEGTKLDIYLQTSINTANAVVGDRVVAVLTNPFTLNGVTVFPQGSQILGTLKKARHATYGSRNGRVVIEFKQLITPENKTYDISAETIDFTVTNEGKVASVASNVAIGAVIGTLVGLLVGAASGNSVGPSMAIGAGVGAGGALIGGTAERGVDAEIPSFTEMELTLTSPINVTINY